MNPNKEINHDNIKVMSHIDSCTSQNAYIRIKSLESFKRANLEGQKLLKSSQHKSIKLFSATKNTVNDLLSCTQAQKSINDSHIALDDGTPDSLKLGEECTI